MEISNMNIKIGEIIELSGEIIELSGEISGTKEEFDEEISDTEELDEKETYDYVNDIIHEYLETEILNISKPDFHDTMKNDIIDICFDSLKDACLCTENSYDMICNIVDDACNEQFMNDYICPVRHGEHIKEEYYEMIYGMDQTFISTYLENKIEKIRKINSNLPKQRSAEWYEQRYNMMTASNIWQLFNSEAQINRFIYDKCHPLELNREENPWINNNNSLHWGVKYEPLATMIYEKMMNVKIEEFGCIPHSEHKFIGASPDGIVTNEGPLYGRMIEIKNIYNRDMDGTPSLAYWIQMQIQMECCDLNACDFIETRFKEYETKEDFENGEHEQRGILLYFITKTGQSNIPTYKYKIYEGESMNDWIEEMKLELPEHAIYMTTYWYLDDIQIKTIQRNTMWFENALPVLKKWWNTILEERVSGYQHRAAKKRVKDTTTIDVIKENPSICLIKLNETESNM